MLRGRAISPLESALPEAIIAVLLDARIIALVLFGMLAQPAICQENSQPAGNPPAFAGSLSSYARMALRDQGRIFSSPSRLRPRDLAWLAPFGAGLSFLVASDRRNMQERIHTSASARDHSLTISTAGTASLMAIPGLLYWKGWHSGDDYTRRTGFLAARAVADTAITTEVLKIIARRARPLQANSGSFSRGGAFSSSFPSLHTAISWAAASAISERYPGWLTKTLTYGLASAVTLSRVTSYRHFPGDVVAGGAIGWMVGHYIGKDPENKRVARFQDPAHQAPAQHAGAGVESASAPGDSAYVPLASWIYGALDRLASFGLIPSQISGLRPWTRAECRRQMQEAAANLQTSARADYTDDAAGLLTALRGELGDESAASGVVLESVYIRNGVIAGQALNDSFHFGQTWINDSGRPFGRGWNSYEGFTARAESGRFFGYVQGEYQHAPGAGAYSLPIRQAISGMDGIPLQQATAVSSTNRFRLLDTYVGVRAGDFEFSIGKQSMWWGPTYDAPLSFSNNAEPTKNLKISTIHPVRLPSFWGLRNEVRGELVFGKLGGQKYTWRPWFNALKISFALTDNLEVGFTRWSILWGVGHPINVHSFVRNWISTNSPTGTATGYQNAADPGDRKGGFDFRYRVPGLRNWLTVYMDSYCDDDPSPLANPRRAATSPGIYLARVPGVPHLDFRLEAPSTRPYDSGWDYLGLIYYNNQYRSGNTNYGYLLGNSIGRDARAVEAWSAYHFSPRNKVELGFRRLKGSTKTIPGGSTQSEVTVKSSLELAPGWYAGAFAQYEKFYVPVLGPRRSNVSGWMQLTWEPHLQILGKRE